MSAIDFDPTTLWSNTNSGVRFTPFAPKVEDVNITDIAHALSNQCRYAGHCEVFYSVAEHSVHVAEAVKLLGGSLDEQREGLMHDATEAYIVDLPNPVKIHPSMDFYRVTEARLHAVIAAKFGMNPAGLSKVVKYADWQLLRLEADVLIPRKPAPWNVPEDDARLQPLASTKFGMIPQVARAFFMARYHALFTDE